MLSWRKVSPIRPRPTPRLCSIHGKDDTLAPYKQSCDMEQALRRARKPLEMVMLDGEDHWPSKGATRTAMLKAAVAFVEKHNPPR